jgi:hypothetical protein
MDAIATFRASINIIQGAIDIIKNPTATEIMSIPTIDDDLSRHLQEASCRCAWASLARDTTSQVDCQSYTKPAVVKCFSQLAPSTFIDTMIETSINGAANVFTFVIIEPSDQGDVSLQLIALDCDTILYNLGVAYCLLAYRLSSMVVKDQVLIDELRLSAYRLFRLIEPFFLERLTWYPSKFDDQSVLMVCTLFVQTMSEVTNHLQYTTVCEHYRTTLTEILLSIGQQELLIPTRSRPASAA